MITFIIILLVLLFGYAIGKHLMNESEQKVHPDNYQIKKEVIKEVERWLRANLHHLSCWNIDEFCISLRSYFKLD